MKLPSKFQIGDEVTVNYSTSSVVGDPYNAVVIAVKFTKSKVFYDVFQEDGIRIVNMIDSEFVKEPQI